MNNALTFTLNLDNSRFSAPADQSVKQLDRIKGAASGANQSLLQLRGGAGFRTGVDIGKATAALKGFAHTFQAVGMQVAPEATMALQTVSYGFKSLKLGAAAAGIPLGAVALGLVGVVAGLATFNEWLKTIKATAEEAGSIKSLANQNVDRRNKLNAIIGEGVGSGAINAELQRKLYGLLLGIDPNAPPPKPKIPGARMPGGISRALDNTPKGRSPEQMARDLNEAARLLQANGIGPAADTVLRSLAEFREKLAAESESDPVRRKLLENTLREKQLLKEAEAKFKLPGDVDPLRAATLSIAMWKQAADTAAMASVSGGKQSSKLPITDLERMGFVFRGGAGAADYQKDIAKNTQTANKTLEKILARIQLSDTRNK